MMCQYSSSLAAELTEVLLSYSEKERFSDICIISSDGMRFNAHKYVLSVFSDYFKVMFGSCLIEATASEVKIHEVNATDLIPILIFLYTSRIELQSEKIEDILKAANFLQIRPLIGECYNFIDKELSVKNCLDIAMFADQYGLIELFQKATKLAGANFERVSKEEEYLKIDECQLMEIISSENLRVNLEEAVVLNLIKWIEYDKLNREKHASKLFSKIRFWLLSEDFIHQYRSKLGYHDECSKMVCKWLEWHSLPDCQRERKQMKFAKPNKPYGLLLVGGGGIQMIDSELNICVREEVSKLPHRFDNIIVFKNKLIISRKDYPLTCFDLETHKITIFLPRMNIPRRSYGLAVLGDELYTIGGYNYNHRKSGRVMDKYNFTFGKWQAVAPMNSILAAPKVSVANGQLYVIGDKSLTMECFNPITNEWTSKSMPDKLNSGFGFTEVDGNLYKIGGKYCDSCVTNLQSYQPCNNLWENRCPMKIEISNPHCIAWNNRLISCGGLGKTGSPLKLVQEYNPILNEWRTITQLIEYNCLKYDYALLAFE